MPNFKVKKKQEENVIYVIELLFKNLSKNKSLYHKSFRLANLQSRPNCKSKKKIKKI